MLFIISQLHHSRGSEKSEPCMPLPTGLEDWVKADGSLHPGIDNSLDYSGFRMDDFLNDNWRSFSGIKTLSLARTTMGDTNLDWDNLLHILWNVTSEMDLDRLSIYGNPVWDIHSGHFFPSISINLTELDVRNCQLYSLKIFDLLLLPKLHRIFLSQNYIFRLNLDIFRSTSLLHLEISDMQEHNKKIGFDGSLPSLQTLDLSSTAPISFKYSEHLSGLRMMSMCRTIIRENLFLPSPMKEFGLKYLDLSENPLFSSTIHDNIGHLWYFKTFSSNVEFDAISLSLEVLIAKNTGLSQLLLLSALSNLKVLSVANNNIEYLTKSEIENFKNLVMLDLEGNKISSWNGELFLNLNKLFYVSLIGNNMTEMTEAMITDLHSISLVGFGQNNFDCTCGLRYFIDDTKKYIHIEHINDSNPNTGLLTHDKDGQNQSSYSYDNWNYILFLIYMANSHSTINDLKKEMYWSAYRINSFDEKSEFHLFDYKEESYTCKEEGRFYEIPISQFGSCYIREYFGSIGSGSVACLLLLLIGLTYWRWWDIKYFFFLKRNRAIIEMNENIPDDPENVDRIYRYDAYVCYARDDTEWIATHFIPQTEEGNGFKICLHERDFEVGGLIIDNIVTCMDSSRTTVLVISRSFLRSIWCVFEMEMAQLRLIGSRREDLILILLEDIPKHERRPGLQHLMKTKTFIEWPKAENGDSDEINLFWERVTKAMQKQGDANSGSNVAASTQEDGSSCVETSVQCTRL